MTISIIAVSCAVVSNTNKSQKTITNYIDWESKAPELFNNAGYSRLIESKNNLDNINNNKVQDQQYIGEVTNPFGIRDDVLDFIINYFPKNESAIYAAIRIEQYDRLIYEVSSEKEAIKLANKDEIPIWCLGNVIGSIGVDRYLDGLGKIRLSTDEGRKMDQDGRRKLGWKILGNHMSVEQMNSICSRGSY